MSDKLARLAEAGFSVSTTTRAQRDVLASLSDEEIGLLMDVKRRIEAVSGDVEGHATVQPGVLGGWLW
jgi:hypothetical protein